MFTCPMPSQLPSRTGGAGGCVAACCSGARLARAACSGALHFASESTSCGPPRCLGDLPLGAVVVDVSLFTYRHVCHACLRCVPLTHPPATHATCDNPRAPRPRRRACTPVATLCLFVPPPASAAHRNRPPASAAAARNVTYRRRSRVSSPPASPASRPVLAAPFALSTRRSTHLDAPPPRAGRAAQPPHP